jgi:hypothetical protein
MPIYGFAQILEWATKSFFLFLIFGKNLEILFLVLKCAFYANNCHFGHIKFFLKLKTN